MTNEINVSGVEINIKGTKHTLSVEECKRLRDALNGLLETRTEYVPYRRYTYPWWPYCDYTPEVTYTDGTSPGASTGILVDWVTV